MSTRVVSKTINLEAAPEQIVEKYITKINDRGITIHPETWNNQSSYIKLDGTGMELFDSNNDSIAYYGSTTRVGKINGGNVSINSGIIDIKDETTTLASFGINGAQIGAESGAHTVIYSDGQDIYAPDGTTKIAQFMGSGIQLGEKSKKSCWLVLNSKGLYLYKSGSLPSLPPDTIGGIEGISVREIWQWEPYSLSANWSFDLDNEPLPETEIKNYISVATTGRVHLFSFTAGVEETFQYKQYEQQYGQFHYDGLKTISYTANPDVITSNKYAYAVYYLSNIDSSRIFVGNHGSKTWGDSTASFGLQLKAQQDHQTVIGHYNDNESNTVFEIGNGTADNARSNALTVDWDGRISAGDYSGNFKSIFDIFYPVGSYYETSLSNAIPSGSQTPTAADIANLGTTWFDPNYAWGGTWTLEAGGKAHISAGSSYNAGTEYGANTKSYTPAGTNAAVTLTAAQSGVPAHKHTIASHGHDDTFSIANGGGSHSHEPSNTSRSFLVAETKGISINRTNIKNGTGTQYDNCLRVGSTAGYVNSTESVSISHSHTLNGSVSGSGQLTSDHNTTADATKSHNHTFTGTQASINVMQASIAVYRWHRTA